MVQSPPVGRLCLFFSFIVVITSFFLTFLTFLIALFLLNRQLTFVISALLEFKKNQSFIHEASQKPQKKQNIHSHQKFFVWLNWRPAMSSISWFFNLWKNKCTTFLFRPSWGGRNYILKWFFFVPWNFADRYIHRRELRLVSLESSSSVEYGIKKIF